jgi:uncharacterized membrane protein YfcA
MLLDVLNSSSGQLLIVLALFLVVAGLMKGIIGVGMPIVALPLLSTIIDVRAAVMLLAVPLILSNIPQALEGGRTLQCLKRLLPVLLGMTPGILLGVTILLAGNPATIKVVAGGVIVLVAMLTWAAPKFQLREGIRTPVGFGAGFAGGVLGGVAALPGPLVFTYLLAKGLRGKEFTKEASLFLVLSSALLAVLLASSSTFDWADVLVSAAALIPVAAGMLLGQKLRALVPADAFKKAVLVIVLLSGLGLVFKSLGPAMNHVVDHNRGSQYSSAPFDA